MDTKRRVQALADMAAYVAKPIMNERGHIKIVSHYDADGICAGAIMYETLKHLNKDFEISFVKQLGRQEILEIAREDNSMLIFTDIGSGQLEYIRERINIPVVVIDHHPPQDCGWSKLYHVNPHLAGIDGETEISGAGAAYVLARSVSMKTKMLIGLAIAGAAGDRQYKNGEFLGVNKLLLEDAEYAGAIRCEKGLKLFGRYTRPIHKAIEYMTEPFIENVSGNESGAVQFLSELGIPVVDSKGRWRKLCDLTKEEEKKLSTVLVLENIACGGSADELIGMNYRLQNDYDVLEFASVLNACGRLEKPLQGLRICLGEPADVEGIMTEYRRKIASAVSWARNNRDKFVVKGNSTYVIAGEKVDENIIGTVVSILLKNVIKTDVVFGFGRAADGCVKVSARAKKTTKMADLDLGLVIRNVVKELGGEAEGGGHTHAAGAMIPQGCEMRFIEIAEKRML